MPHAWKHVGGSVQDTGDGVGTKLMETAEVSGAVPGVKSGGHVGVSSGSPSESTWCGMRGAGTPPGRPKSIGYLSQKF